MILVTVNPKHVNVCWLPISSNFAYIDEMGYEDGIHR